MEKTKGPSEIGANGNVINRKKQDMKKIRWTFKVFFKNLDFNLTSRVMPTLYYERLSCLTDYGTDQSSTALPMTMTVHDHDPLPLRTWWQTALQPHLAGYLNLQV